MACQFILALRKSHMKRHSYELHSLIGENSETATNLFNVFYGFFFPFSDSLKSRIRMPGISEILPSLYLCGAGVAIPVFLEKLGITCVINAAPELPDTPLPESTDDRSIFLFKVPVLDKSDINISDYFDEVADLIEHNRQTNGRTMVHCVAGVSRSASLVLAYLMKYMRMYLKDAFELVRSAR